MGRLILTSKKGYTNEDAVGNVINYLYRAATKEDPTEKILCFGGLGVSQEPDSMVAQITYVQMACRSPSTIGTRTFHEIFTFTPEEAELFRNRYDLLSRFTMESAYVYYSMGHQIAYAVHYGKVFGLHIHFAGNAVSFYDGSKWYNNEMKLKLMEREQYMNQILEHYMAESGKEIIL
ncbi:MAG: hypothetical protein LUG99_12005 [Lachnospiraceae bacterium]|nr:hypothetical protein [Lachnospiraceae bacterium]